MYPAVYPLMTVAFETRSTASISAAGEPPFGPGSA